MKKIGILTLDGIVNYGNRLQNYAMQTILEKEGFGVDTIVAKKGILKPMLINLRTIIHNPLRTLKFIVFNSKYINLRRIYMRSWDIPFQYAEKYDYFVVGSDQVWNPNIRKRERNNFLLNFAKPHQRVAVAASLSVGELNENDAVVYKNNITQFRTVSTREFEGAEIIKNLCGREVEVLCDPTLALDRGEWDKMAIMPKIKLPERYLLTYFLGDVSKERMESIEKYALAHNLEIVKLNDKTDKNIYNSGPCEFLGLIKNATVVCTDSFHGLVFSAIFNIAFWGFYRESKVHVIKNMESRMTSLQKKIGVSDRLITKLTVDMPIECDFTMVNQKIQYEREKFISFLKSALE